ncbi:hypothetical protein SCUCBS95973_007451 [Sporothrix curviconia]|uniref:Protein kinase domain-containing protein n=1 Tax=Sporothrix curviconia TaxID=1260050 RepID=A0ABP0CG46_9PEZI
MLVYRHPGDINGRNVLLDADRNILLYDFAGSGIDDEDDWAGEAVRLLREGTYPDVSNVALGDIMQKCWKTEFTSAKQVADSIHKRLPQYANDTEMF